MTKTTKTPRKPDTARTFTAPDRKIEKHEVFTPRHLIDSMMDKLEPGISELDTTFFEPAAGDGNIVIAVLERKLNKAGWTKENAERAVKSIFGCEYMKDNRDAIIQRIGAVLDEHHVIPMHEYVSSECHLSAESQIAYCNTIDPWDTSDNRQYPIWLATELTQERWEKFRKKSKFYKSNKTMWAGVDGTPPKPVSLEDLFG